MVNKKGMTLNCLLNAFELCCVEVVLLYSKSPYSTTLLVHIIMARTAQLSSLKDVKCLSSKNREKKKKNPTELERVSKLLIGTVLCPCQGHIRIHHHLQIIRGEMCPKWFECLAPFPCDPIAL